MAENYIYQVVVAGDRWHVRQGEAVLGRYPTQQLAAEAAKSLARRQRGVAVWHDRKGQEIGRVDARVADERVRQPTAFAVRGRGGRRRAGEQVAG